MKIEDGGVQTLIEDAVGLECVDEGFVGGAFGEEDASGFGIGGAGGQGNHYDQQDQYYQQCCQGYEECFFLHNIFCILIESMYFPST